MDKAKPTTRTTQVRFLRFLVVGGVSAAVQFSTLWLWSRWFAPVVAFSLSFACSTSTHYTCNRFWALPSERTDSGRQFGEYLGTVGISYLVNLLTFKFCQGILGMDVMWAAFCAIPPSTVVVFLLLNYRVFRAYLN
ncbi:MAG TPA: GtrA family protein [Candidatus Didemnitutus sp.]|nr:GtrA family protein [Candidatus Didemnitutus sp.]